MWRGGPAGGAAGGGPGWHPAELAAAGEAWERAAERAPLPPPGPAGRLRGGSTLDHRSAVASGKVPNVENVRRSKTDQDGAAANVRYLKNGYAVALRQLRDRITVQRSDADRPGARRPEQPVHRIFDIMI